ncbi:E3 ubiquitin-protein ligase synoviolin A-like [Babylonia areolata]|uniref:E3 ubiquitin-protein ligase synoviolin A-like n=1 Tax=Babylonia areolata TaxID=304850 RepID=UPI003FD5DA81
MRSLVISGISFAMTAGVIANAYYQKKQFYPSVVYITKSNPSMAVIYLQAFVFVILMGKLLRKIFFGQLRAAEMEHLIERSWYAVTETCLAFTVFRDDFSPRFVALFTLLLFLKCFHWLAEDRVDFMERSPVISILFHMRVLSLLTFLGMLDMYFVNHAYYSTLVKGPTVQLVFGFEYAILFTVIAMTFIKYVLHTVDLQHENPWDNKAVYLLYTELFMGLTRVVLYFCFMAIMIKVHTFPLFAIRPMYLAIRSLKKALHDVIMSRRAIRNMNTLYPNATPEELAAGDNVCIICREEMTTGCKKLPCNHIFHTSCLRSWFQRQQTCPTCRLDVLRMPRPTPATPAPEAGGAAANAQANTGLPMQQPPQQFFQNFQGFGGFPFAWPPMQQPGVQPVQANGQQPQQAGTPSTGGATTATTSSSSTTTTTTAPTGASPTTPTPPPPFYPSMPFFMPPFCGFPPPTSSLGGLSEEELQGMEGAERASVEARVQWLRDIQTLLDGAMVLIAQYNQVAASMGMSGIQTAPLNVQQPPLSSASASASATAAGATSTATATASWRPSADSSKGEASTANTSKNNAASASPQQQTVGSVNSEEKLDYTGLEGATGFTPAQDMPQWEDPQQEEHEDEMHEVRRRRLQRFSQDSQQRGNADNLDLD